MAVVAAHLGVIDEEAINNMSIVFFDDVLMELGHKLTYDAVVNYAGNSFCEKSWDMITENNPLNVSDEPKATKALKGIADLFNSSSVKIGKPPQRK